MGDQKLSEAQVNAYFRQMQSDNQQIAAKISELEVEVNEHNLVITAIDKLEPSRKCFRLVGGVLVERTVAEVLPAVKKNADALNDLIKQLQQQLEKRSQEMNEFIVQHKIQVRGQHNEETSSKETESNPGVLV